MSFFSIILGPLSVCSPIGARHPKCPYTFLELERTGAGVAKPSLLEMYQTMPMPEEVEIGFNVSCDLGHPTDLSALLSPSDGAMRGGYVKDRPAWCATLVLDRALKHPPNQGIISKILGRKLPANPTVGILSITEANLFLVVSREKADTFCLYRRENGNYIVHTSIHKVVNAMKILGVQGANIEALIRHANRFRVVSHPNPTGAGSPRNEVHRLFESTYYASLTPEVNVPHGYKVNYGSTSRPAKMRNFSVKDQGSPKS